MTGFGIPLPYRFDTLRQQIARYRWLREYYLMNHLQLVLGGRPFRDEEGNRLGHLEEVRLHQGRLHLRGWTTAPRLTLRLGDTMLVRQPHEERGDVAAALGCEARVGFSASLPLANGALLIELDRDGAGPIRFRHRLRIGRAMVLARLRLGLRFWRDALPIAPMVVKGLMRGDADLPRRVKVALRLGHGGAETSLDGAFLATPGAPAPAALETGISVIVPVFNAFELLPEALDRVIRHTDLPWRLILIEDASTDPRVRPWLRDWVARQDAANRIDLLENDRNLGFIRTVNRGFEHLGPGPDPVVILNTDAMVPADWASRLVAPLGDPGVATATPISNNAEIFTAPIACVPIALDPGHVDRIDAALRERIADNAPRVQAPTGVGFCMAIRRDWLERIGPFDTGFGPGYGEEVDWCRKAAAQGGQHVAIPDLFVEHRGGVSFGAEKLALIRNNNAVISARYPGYDRAVQEFVRDDPLLTPRLVAALAWADSLPGLDEIPVVIAHSLGGGAENYLQDRLARERVAIVLRFGGSYRYRIELRTPSGTLSGSTDDPDLVLRLLAPLARRRIVYSCAVGDPDLRDLPKFLLRLAGTAPLDVLFHDYLPISPSYTLLDQDGVYRGVPAPDHDDPAHAYRSPDGRVTPLAEWRAQWSEVMDRADRLVVFSQASAEIVRTAFPRAAARIVVRPHTLLQAVPPLPVPQGERIVIGVLGAIGPQKGAAVLAALATRLRAHTGIGMALIGRIAPGFPLGRKVPIHGIYAIEDIPALAARYGVTHWLIPSIWPETFSFTVHECLASGLPTLAFDLGAQGEAVRKARNGVVLPWEPGAREPETLARLVIDAVATHTAQPK
jgi:O-antigen biosynthesis protein